DMRSLLSGSDSGLTLSSIVGAADAEEAPSEAGTDQPDADENGVPADDNTEEGTFGTEGAPEEPTQD
ncbi:MAG: hypothetical protein L0K34_00760, partial [Ancrocorticia sp.]|nr:hypothetical protein [Ancrocorticia sp.]